MKIRKEGFPFIAISAGLSHLLAKTRVGIFGIVPLASVTWFFRDPYRVVPEGDGLVISPADGKVLGIEALDEEHVGKAVKISVFMSVFNVHVNRNMVGGTVIEKKYCPGKFHMANMGKKTQDNERMILYLKNDDGIFRVDQVAGMVARRISCWPEIGDTLEAGKRFGLIRFGSLLECYLPEKVDVSVKKGDRVFAGQSILGRIKR